MNRLLFAFFSVTGLAIELGVATASPPNEPEVPMSREQVEQRLHDARHNAGLDRMGELQNPTELQIAAKMIGRISAGIMSGHTLESGLEIPPRTVVDSLEWVTGVDLDLAANLDEIVEMYSVRERRRDTLNQKLCDIALDDTYADLEFVNEMNLIGQKLNDSFEFYGQLKMLLPTEAVVALQEHEVKLAATIVQEDRNTALEKYALEVPDLMRMSHAQGCSADLAED